MNTFNRPTGLLNHRADFFAAALYAVIILFMALIYLRQASVYGTDAPLMPVDDAYIHFQYARQAANLQPFVYNLGQDPSSGATSLIYPFILAVGYKLGFTGLNLGYWAYIVGAAALLLSALTVRTTSRAAGLPRWLYNLMGASVAAWGALVWHAFSGMETALAVAFTLLTYHTFERRRFWPFVSSASVLAVLRPEASVMAGIAAVVYALREIFGYRSHVSEVEMHAGSDERAAPLAPYRIPLLLIPVAFAAIQPLLNVLLTGTPNASGSQAKSLLSIVPFELDYVVSRILENVVRAWEGFLFGISFDGAFILPPLLGIFALFGLFSIGRKRPLTALLPLLWLILIFSAIATLDTAVWHFRRYHMPLLALAFPLTAHAAAAFGSHPRSRALLIGYTLILSVFLNTRYMDFHRANVESIAAQPLAMARWLSANTLPDALIAVHDVGLIRYLGDRDTLDMVGLTTPGMADAWRNGPGAVGEAIIAAPRRPDYFAAYTDARGLSYLADSLYGVSLIGFVHEFDPATNVALAGTFQGIYRPTWEGADAAVGPQVGAVVNDLEGFTLTDTLNVANLADERVHDYRWSNISRFDGFASEMYLLDVPGCSSDCRVLDGGRRINGGESFILAAQPDRDHILVSRFHAPDGGKIRVVINNTYIVERTLPAIPGQFVEIPTLIPAALVQNDALQVNIESTISGPLLFPYRHWLFAGDFVQVDLSSAPIAFQNDSILLSVEATNTGDTLAVDLDWWTDGTSTGDFIAFIHLYKNLNEPPVVQSDLRPGGGAMPPGAWLPGVISDRVVLDLGDLPYGAYTLAVGLYAHRTFERLEPVVNVQARVPSSATYSVDDGRILIETIEIAPRP